jgi:hypothetical protein
MFDQEKKIGIYRLRQDENSVVIDEHKGFIHAAGDFVFGLVFMFPMFLFMNVFFVNIGWLHPKDGWLLLEWKPHSEPVPIWSWLVVLPFLCVPVFFAYIGSSIAFARFHLEATSEKIFIGNTWFGLPVKLKTMPVSEIAAIKLNWEKRGVISSYWFCVVSILIGKKSVPLFGYSEKKVAWELANVIGEITKLPVQDVPQT